jgi:hypothetical protein
MSRSTDWNTTYVSRKEVNAVCDHFSGLENSEISQGTKWAAEQYGGFFVPVDLDTKETRLLGEFLTKIRTGATTTSAAATVKAIEQARVAC